MSKRETSSKRSATLLECSRNPSAVLQRAKREGAIVVTDSKGRPRGVLCVPTDLRPFDLAN